MEKKIFKSSCVFCKIVSQKLKSWTIYENNEVVVFLDVAPLAKGHSLVITKNCHQNILQLNEKELLAIQKGAQIVTQMLIEKLQPKGFNFINNFNSIAGQAINHYHLHIIPKYENDYGYIWHKNVKQERNSVEEIWNKIKK